mmetsp:Transcript_139155/g.432963  ORF Transcript_139155/g.432963 Transcript_139155/m.432963 type:complete len:300 (-) Transcript_139155:895-1794(-)
MATQKVPPPGEEPLLLLRVAFALILHAVRVAIALSGLLAALPVAIAPSEGTALLQVQKIRLQLIVLVRNPLCQLPVPRKAGRQIPGVRLAELLQVQELGVPHLEHLLRQLLAVHAEALLVLVDKIPHGSAIRDVLVDDIPVLVVRQRLDPQSGGQARLPPELLLLQVHLLRQGEVGAARAPADAQGHVALWRADRLLGPVLGSRDLQCGRHRLALLLGRRLEDRPHKSRAAQGHLVAHVAAEALDELGNLALADLQVVLRRDVLQLILGGIHELEVGHVDVQGPAGLMDHADVDLVLLH